MRFNSTKKLLVRVNLFEGTIKKAPYYGGFFMHINQYSHDSINLDWPLPWLDLFVVFDLERDRDRR